MLFTHIYLYYKHHYITPVCHITVNSTLTVHTLKFYFYETIHCNRMKHSSGQKSITSQHLTFFGMAEVEIVIPQQLTRRCLTKLLQQVSAGLVISCFLQLGYTLSCWVAVWDKIWTPSSHFHNTTRKHLEYKSSTQKFSMRLVSFCFKFFTNQCYNIIIMMILSI